MATKLGRPIRDDLLDLLSDAYARDGQAAADQYWWTARQHQWAWRALDDALEPGEHLIGAASCGLAKAGYSPVGVAVVTDQRIVMAGGQSDDKRGLFAESITEVALDDIVRTSTHVSRLSHQLRLDTSSKKFHLKGMTASGQRGLVDALRRARSTRPTDTPGVAVELERLADLRARGALTDAEFTRAKSRLLGQDSSE